MVQRKTETNNLCSTVTFMSNMKLQCINGETIMAIESKELQIVSEFRKNARENLTTASRKLRIPVSTIYDRLRKYQGSLIVKHTSLLNFEKLGFSIQALLAFSVPADKRKEMSLFLQSHHRVNSVFRVSNDSDFFIELVCRNLPELQTFKEKIENLQATNVKEYYIVEELLRESFLTNNQTIDILADM